MWIPDEYFSVFITKKQNLLGPVILSLFYSGKARRGMLRRAVFSDIQRKGLEKRFHIQKYISKPDRKKLADQLGLKDSQVRNILISWLSNNWGVSGEDLVSKQEDEMEEQQGTRAPLTRGDTRADPPHQGQSEPRPERHHGGGCQGHGGAPGQS